jgi:SHS2 domain-containing protein
VLAPDLPTLFAEAARALFAAIVEDPTVIEARQIVTFTVEGAEPDYLLFDWLNELLFRFETRHLVFSSFAVEFSSKGIDGKAWGEPVEQSRHRFRQEVKAITYHALKVERVADGWLAEVIVDI